MSRDPLDVVICPGCGKRLKKRNGGRCSEGSVYAGQCGGKTGCGFEMGYGEMPPLNHFIAEKTWTMTVCADFVRAVYAAAWQSGVNWHQHRDQTGDVS